MQRRYVSNFRPDMRVMDYNNYGPFLYCRYSIINYCFVLYQSTGRLTAVVYHCEEVSGARL